MDNSIDGNRAGFWAMLACGSCLINGCHPEWPLNVVCALFQNMLCILMLVDMCVKCLVIKNQRDEKVRIGVPF